MIFLHKNVIFLELQRWSYIKSPLVIFFCCFLTISIKPRKNSKIFLMALKFNVFRYHDRPLFPAKQFDHPFIVNISIIKTFIMLYVLWHLCSCYDCLLINTLVAIKLLKVANWNFLIYWKAHHKHPKSSSHMH